VYTLNIGDSPQNKKNDMKMIDLKTQDGRLINNMPTQETGIAKVSRMAAARNATKLSAARNTARAARMDMMMDMMEQKEIRK
jgi:3-keto-L-gulonate-6-phosphate decarboxylase